MPAHPLLVNGDLPKRLRRVPRFIPDDELGWRWTAWIGTPMEPRDYTFQFGKTHTERMVPMHEDAAEAVRVVQALHRGGRGLPDRKTRLETHYLFTRKGKLLGRQYLFEDALREACEVAGPSSEASPQTVE